MLKKHYWTFKNTPPKNPYDRTEEKMRLREKKEKLIEKRTIINARIAQILTQKKIQEQKQKPGDTYDSVHNNKEFYTPKLNLIR